jgi:serine protease
MSRRLPLVALAVLVTGLSASLVAQQALPERALRRPAAPALRAAPGEVIVGFAGGADPARIEEAVRRVGGTRARRSRFENRYLVTLEAGRSTAAAVAELQAMPEVALAEVNGVMSAFASSFVPDDPFFELQWHMKLIGAERTWAIQKGDPSVGIAILDTGIAFEDFGRFRKAPDFGDTVFLEGFNALDGSSHANDDNFHGTHVASTVAEATDNGVGVAGLAFRCSLMPVKVLDSDGNGFFFEVAEGIDYVTNFRQDGTNPVKVINLSLGSDFESQIVSRAIERAAAAGIVVLAAAGNGGKRGISFPASHPDVIAVGAVDGRKQAAPYTNSGEELDVMAPGGDVDRDDDDNGRPDGVLQQTFSPQTALRDGRFDDFGLFYVDGTSQAVPHVAALAALLIRQGITDPEAVRAAITTTAEDLGEPGRDDVYGHGLIDPAKALSGLGLVQ